MIIDITELIKAEGAELELNFEELLPEQERMYNDFRFEEPVWFSGTLANGGGALRLQGRIDAPYAAICARCTAPVNGKLNINIDEEIFNENENVEDDIYTHNGKYLDIDKIIKDNIILKLPMIQLCSSTCRGLCPVCGCDLNEEQCECKTQDINPRFEILNKLLNDEETEKD